MFLNCVPDNTEDGVNSPKSMRISNFSRLVNPVKKEDSSSNRIFLVLIKYKLFKLVKPDIFSHPFIIILLK